MFAIIGWLVVAAFLVQLSAGWGIMAMNGLGKYNIGGVPNKTSHKVFIWVAFVVLLYFWNLLILAAPFKLVTA